MIQKVILVFALCSLITLIAGVGLEISGDAIGKHIGMTGVLFGAAILAAATALLEVSIGLASMKLKDYQMAMSEFSLVEIVMYIIHDSIAILLAVIQYQ